MRISIILLFSLMARLAIAQSNEKATEMKAQAIDLMENGKPDEAIVLLEEARKLDPKNWAYDYEKAYAYYIKKDFLRSIEIYKKVTKYDNAIDQCYQMLGNMYDINGEPDQALKTYEKGIKKFPNSGRLYLEEGNVYFNQKKYDEALPFYEKGIKAEPQFPSNYYRAALLYCNSTEPVWGMIYGEIFINLERNSERTSEISKLLFDTYKSQINFKGDTCIVHFSNANVVTVEDVMNHKMPFGPFVYEPVLLVALIGEHGIDINSLDSVRTRFVENYYTLDFSKNKKNLLFDFQNSLLKQGFLSSYNHWVLSEGDRDKFDKWRQDNEEAWKRFVSWFTEHPMLVDENNRFHSSQY